jgi:hypothetical protein
MKEFQPFALYLLATFSAWAELDLGKLMRSFGRILFSAEKLW